MITIGFDENNGIAIVVYDEDDGDYSYTSVDRDKAAELANMLTRAVTWLDCTKKDERK